jgi:multidrug resistance efflux pump
VVTNSITTGPSPAYAFESEASDTDDPMLLARSGSLRGEGIVEHAVGVSVLLLSTLAGAFLLVSSAIHLNRAVSVSGAIVPSQERAVHARASGVIDSVLVRPGDSVASGTVIALLDSRAVRSQLDELDREAEAARLDVVSAKRALPLDSERLEAELQLASAGELRARAQLTAARLEAGWTSRGVRDSTTADTMHVGVAGALASSAEAAARVRLARSAINGLQARSVEIERIETNLKRLEGRRRHLLEELDLAAVRTPVSGIVVSEDLENLVGQRVEVGQPLLSIASHREWRAWVFVREAEAHFVHAGQNAELMIEGAPNERPVRLRGVVARVADQPARGEVAGAAVPSSSNAGTLYRVEIQLPSLGATAYDGRLRYGVSVHGQIITARTRLISFLLGHFLPADDAK